MAIVCPECGQADQIAKVQAIVAGGTSYSTGQFVSARSTSDLASILRSPGIPGYTPLNDYNLGGWAWYPIAISVLAACIGGIAIADSYKYPEQETLGAAWAWTLVLVFFFALLAIILRRSQRSYDRKNRDRQIAFQPTVEKYQAAIDLWATLYFCGRDAIVFTPTTPPKTAPFTQMHQFLKREVGVS